MVILNKENSNNSIISLIVVFCVICQNAFASNLLEMRQGNDKSGRENVISTQIDFLQREIRQTSDRHSLVKLKYGLGVLKFKIGQYQGAYEIFKDISRDTVGYKQLHIATLNMMAHSLAFDGNFQESLSSFQELIKVISNFEDRTEFENELLCSAYASCAMIYIQADRLDNAFSMYSHLGGLSDEAKGDRSAVIVRRANLQYLRLLYAKRDFEGYLDLINELVESESLNDFTGALELQRVSYAFLKARDERLYHLDPAKLPVEALAVINKKPDELTEDFVEKLRVLCEKYEEFEYAIYLHYIYGWALDKLNKTTEAISVFQKVIEISGAFGEDSRYAFLGEYSKVQLSVILGESKDYASATQILSKVDVCQIGHLADIKDSVGKSLEILRREVK